MSIVIPLTQGKTAVISDEDADLAELGWYYESHIKRKRIYEHAQKMDYSGDKPRMLRLYQLVLERIIGRPLDKKVDRAEHLDGNTLNCQRENIRYLTKSSFQQKAIYHGDNAPGYRGVYFQKNARLWHAQIHEQETQHYLGLYASAEEAARAYDQAALELYGEHAKLNFPIEKA